MKREILVEQAGSGKGRCGLNRRYRRISGFSATKLPSSLLPSSPLLLHILDACLLQLHHAVGAVNAPLPTIKGIFLPSGHADIAPFEVNFKHVFVSFIWER